MTKIYNYSNQARSQKCIPGEARPHTNVRLKCNEDKIGICNNITTSIVYYLY